MIRILILALLLMAQAPKVTLTINPLVLFTGDDLHLMCRVEKLPTNRWVQYGIEDYSQSTRQLDETSPIMFEQWYHHVPCESTQAFCAVSDSTGKVTLKTQSITVTGCN